MVEIFQPGGGGSGGGVDSVVAGSGISVNNTDPANPVVSADPSGINHNLLSNLTTGDPHTQYALLVGRSGGQSLSGGTAANDDLTLQGTTNATRTTSYVLLQPNGGFVGIGTSTPSQQLEITGSMKLPVTTSTNGNLYIGNTRIHSYGTQNLFAGEGAGSYTLTGTNNFGLGASALSNLTSGSANIAVGSSAMRDMQSGTNNVALGPSTMITATSGSGNSTFGYQAGYGLNGSDNVVAGYNALSASNVTSNKTVSIGRDSGGSQTTGDRDIYIGYNAHPGSNNLTNAIAIGANSVVNASNTGVLGGTGSDAVRMGVGAGTSTSYAKLGGTLFDHYADVGNSTTTETDLYSDTIPASALAANGDKLEAEYGGTFVSSGTATREVKIYFGGTAIFDTGALTLSLSSAWTVYVTIIRVSSTVVRYMISFTTEGATLSAYTAVGELTGLTLSNTNILKITGQAAGVGAATNDIVAKMGTISWLPSA